MIFPQHPARILWIFVGVAFIMYECVAVPILLCFDTDPVGAFKVFGYVVTFYFLGDVLISFFTGYQTPAGETILEPGIVISRYLRSWFVPDMLASVPLDMLLAGTGSGGGRSFKLMRFLRLLRLARLIRIMKLKTIMNVVEARMEGNTMFRFASRLFKLLGFLAMAMHWCACLWYLWGTLEKEQGESQDSWVKVPGGPRIQQH